jgi:hypothetical protein
LKHLQKPPSATQPHPSSNLWAKSTKVQYINNSVPSRKRTVFPLLINVAVSIEQTEGCKVTSGHYSVLESLTIFQITRSHVLWCGLLLSKDTVFWDVALAVWHNEPSSLIFTVRQEGDNSLFQNVGVQAVKNST